MINFEIIGFCASILILISACCNTHKEKGIILLRALNMVGSLVYVYYGFLINSYSLIFLNAFMAIINAVYFYRHIQHFS